MRGARVLFATLALAVAVLGADAGIAHADDSKPPNATASEGSPAQAAPAQGATTEGSSANAPASAAPAQSGADENAAGSDDANVTPPADERATGTEERAAGDEDEADGASGQGTAGTTSQAPVSSSPQQETESSAGSTTDNNSSVDQTAGQVQEGSEDAGAANGSGQGQGQREGQGEGQAAGDGSGSTRSQQATTAQTAGSVADAASNGVRNTAGGTRVGSAGIGHQGGIHQGNSADAIAAATNTQTTSGQSPRSESSTQQGSGQQTATTAASATSTDPQNTIVLVRVDAPGDNAAFDQTNTATASATTTNQAGGTGSAPGVAQSGQATASATLNAPNNVAVDLRINSAGDSAGGSQRNEASAGASAANANAAGTHPATSAAANATVANPQNTFVSIRVNSDGETGPVTQETLRDETTSVNGETESTVVSDPEDRFWTTAKANGPITISFTSDGENTDLRIGIDSTSLVSPTDGDTFMWTWDMTFGGDTDPTCAISSQAAVGQVAWVFDCDPENQIAPTTSNGSTPAPQAGSITWTWNWTRNDLSDWTWSDRNNLTLLTCTTCTYVFNFNWLSTEPVGAAPSSAAATASAPAVVAEPPAISQTNAVSAEAVTENSSSVGQMILVGQTQEASATEGAATEANATPAAQVQNVMQVALVAQQTLSQSVTQLVHALNESIVLDGRVLQENSSAAEAVATATASIEQAAVQLQQGAADSLQSQEAIQSATTSQNVVTTGAAALHDAVNSILSQNAVVTQTVSALGSATGISTSETTQYAEQLQSGADSQQQQISGQWGTVDQSLQLVGVSVLRDAYNESTATGDTSSQMIGARSEASGSAASTTTQGVFQSQSGDHAIQSQEAYQIATVEQSGVGAAATSAGPIVHRYATPPPADTTMVAGFVAPNPVAGETAVAIDRPSGANGWPSRARPDHSSTSTSHTFPARVGAVQHARAALAETLSSVSTQVSSSLAVAGRAFRHVVAAEASSKAEDDEGVTGGSLRRSTTPAPLLSGASAGSTGSTASGGALAALVALLLLAVPALGRRLFSSVGKRRTVVLLLDTRPG